MQTRNYILFLVLSMAILIGWERFVLPHILPKPAAKNLAQQPEKPIPDKAAAADAGKAGAKPADAKPAVAAAKDAATKTAVAASDPAKAGEKHPAAAGKEQAAAPKAKAIPVFDHKSIKIGSLDPSTGYFLEAEIDSKGASVASLKLNDPRYRDLKDASVPLNLMGNDFDLRFFKLLQDRDTAQSEQSAAAQLLKEAETVAQTARDSAAQLAKEIETGAHPKDSSSEAELERRRAAVQTAETELERDRLALQTAEENLHRAERDITLAQRTFNTDVPEIDAALPPDQKNVAGRDWAVAEVTPDAAYAGVNSAVTFRYPSPDGQLVVEKRYSLIRIDGAGTGDGSSKEARRVRDSDTGGYLLQLDVSVKNAGAAQRTASYVLQGPVGVPLENADNTRKFRDLKMGFLTPEGTVNATSKTVSAVIADEKNKKDQEWKAPTRYIGVDVQYFAALVIPGDDQLKDQTVERSIPMVLDRPTIPTNTDVSVQLDSKPIVLQPQQTVTQHFKLFAGPKRKELLLPLQADGILDTSWFSPPIVSQAMLGLLNFFHSLGLQYGLAIICLTICVRACMFPLSLRQTAQAQRMKEMQPRIEELKKKFGTDKEKFAVAQMQLWREHKINPLSGCLPLFVQLPIFTGLWMALNSSVDLRRAPFLYFNNLAAPDALFHLPFAVPYLGWTDFNLLPFITVALFVVQQKMFMPPPTDEQQAMQYKMMNVMTIVMGVMFYKVPAGLCVYFISSSLWGIGERKLLEFWKKKHPQPVAPPVPAAPPDDKALRMVPSSANKAAARAGEAAGSIWKRLLSAADDAGAKGMSGSNAPVSRRRDVSPGKKSGKRPRG
jgi:YidC/Oxa1 family membrane protein insertase